MADVFVSYSRRDTEFVDRLVKELEARGKDVWVDVEGIRDAEVFPAALRAAVEGSDAFVFVISPDSVASPFCEQEVGHAVELNKRIVPLLLRPVPDDQMPEGIRERNWIPADGANGFEPAVDRLVGALDTDLAWTKEHTRWLLKALEWEREQRDRSFLLRGAELGAAERWLASAADMEPQPTALQTEYTVASRMAATRRQRAFAGASLIVTAVAISLLVFALISRSQAISARNTAQSQALAADSQTQLNVDPERSILLAAAALQEATTPQALFALRGALDASPIRFRLPDAGVQSCGFDNIVAPGVAFSPDGRQLAEGLCNGDVVLADARSGRVERRIHVGGIAAGPVAYSSAGSELAAASVGHGVELIDLATGTVRPTGQHTAGRFRVAFSPTSPLLAISGNGQVTLFDLKSRKTRLLHFPTAALNAPTNALAFSRDGKRLVVGLVGISSTSVGLLVLDVVSGRTLASARGGADDVAFSPDGANVVAAETLFPAGNGRVVLLDSRTLALRRTLAELPGVAASAVAVSRDGSRVAFGGFDGTAGLASVQTGQSLVSYLGQTAAINQVAFSPDGSLVATASSDGSTRVWRATGLPLEQVDAGGFIQALDPVSAGLAAVVQSGGPGGPLDVRTWSGRPAHPGRPLQISPTGKIDAVFLSADGRLAGVIPNPPAREDAAPLRIWSVATRRVIATLPSSPVPFGGEPVFSPDGRSIAMGKIVGPSRVGPRKAVRGRPPSGLPPRPQAALVLVDARTGKTRIFGSTSCGTGWRSEAFSRDGSLLAAGSFCGGVDVWNVATGRPVGRPFSIGGELAQVAFNRDATQLAVASWNSTITIADVRTGRIAAVLTDHTRGVAGVAYSPDGRYLASASLDRSARIWDAHTLQRLRILAHPDPVYSIAFTPDSRSVVTEDGAQVIRLWDACTACGNRSALLALARTRVTRQLTPQEQRTFLSP